MKRQNKYILILLAIIATAIFATGCEDKQAIETNKLIDAADKKMSEAQPIFSAAMDKYAKIIGSIQDFEESKGAHDGEVKELIASYDKVAELQKGAAADFTQAAKLSKDETFKAYYEMTVKKIENSAALVNQNRVLAQAFIDSKTEDDYVAKVAGIKTKNESLTKESEEIAGKLKSLGEAVKAKNKS